MINRQDLVDELYALLQERFDEPDRDFISNVYTNDEIIRYIDHIINEDAFACH